MIGKIEQLTENKDYVPNLDIILENGSLIESKKQDDQFLDRRYFIERVAAGLRKCKVAPDFLIWIDNKDYIWDEETILGIPVLIVAGNVSYTPYGDSDLPFIPCWKDDSKTDKYSHCFERGYEDY